MVDLCREGHNQKSASQKRHKVHWTSAKTEGGTAEGIRCPAPEENVLIKLLAA